MDDTQIRVRLLGIDRWKSEARKALAEMYAEGKARGRRSLLQLASGENLASRLRKRRPAPGRQARPDTGKARPASPGIDGRTRMS